MDLSQTLDLVNLLGFAFLANVPLGYLREGSRKLSLRWFVYVHLSIPFIVFMRISQGFGWEAVPFSIACAIAGQLLGGRVYRQRER